MNQKGLFKIPVSYEEQERIESEYIDAIAFSNSSYINSIEIKIFNEMKEKDEIELEDSEIKEIIKNHNYLNGLSEDIKANCIKNIMSKIESVISEINCDVYKHSRFPKSVKYRVNSSSIIGISISLLLIGILLPIGLNDILGSMSTNSIIQTLVATLIPIMAVIMSILVIIPRSNRK